MIMFIVSIFKNCKIRNWIACPIVIMDKDHVLGVEHVDYVVHKNMDGEILATAVTVQLVAYHDMNVFFLVSHIRIHFQGSL